MLIFVLSVIFFVLVIQSVSMAEILFMKSRIERIEREVDKLKGSEK